MKKKIVLDTFTIVIGCFLVAVGLDVFAIPNNISPGGVSGLAAALSSLVPISVGTFALLINFPLLIVAWRVLGIRQLSRTIAATILLSFFIDLVAACLPVYAGNVLLAAVLGGVLVGAGIGILFLRGISTGGTDLLSILLLRPMPNLPVGALLLFIDASVVAVAVIVFRDIEVALYSIVMLFVTSQVIDAIMNGANYAKVVYIVTDHGDSVTEALNTKTDRGVTIIPGRGGYTGQDKTVLMTVTRRNTLAQTLTVIKHADPTAFSFVINAAEVHGEGFHRYRADIGHS